MSIISLEVSKQENNIILLSWTDTDSTSTQGYTIELEAAIAEKETNTICSYSELKFTNVPLEDNIVQTYTFSYSNDENYRIMKFKITSVSVGGKPADSITTLVLCDVGPTDLQCAIDVVEDIPSSSFKIMGVLKKDSVFYGYSPEEAYVELLSYAIQLDENRWQRFNFKSLSKQRLADAAVNEDGDLILFSGLELEDYITRPIGLSKNIRFNISLSLGHESMRIDDIPIKLVGNSSVEPITISSVKNASGEYNTCLPALSSTSNNIFIFKDNTAQEYPVYIFQNNNAKDCGIFLSNNL